MYKKFYSIALGALFSGLLQGLALATFGGFQDSANYRELFENVVNMGFVDSLIGWVAQTAKFEPMILLLFSAEGWFLGDSSSEFTFLLLNMVVLNLLVVSAMYALMDRNARNTAGMFMVGFVIMLTYPVFSKQLYFWRSIIGFVFFIAFIKDRSWRRLLWALIAACGHFSIVLFIPFFLVVEAISRVNKKPMYLALFAAMLSVVFVVQLFPDAFGVFASGGDASVLLAAGGAHAIKVWLSVLFAFIVLLLVYREFMEHETLRAVYVFCLATVIASLLSYNSYHFMNRLFLPASIIVGFLPFLIRNNCNRFKLAKFLVIVSVLPSLRLLYMLFAGTFAPE